jgi:c(7)-type cytochrome triheme protein
MKRILKVLAIFVLFAFPIFPPCFSDAVHEPLPDMEHGESVTAEPDPAAVPGKVGGGDVIFQVKGAANVTFSHDNHIQNAGLKCTDCHDRLYVTAERDKPVTMAEMQKQKKSCGACHDGQKAFTVAGNCGNCHK